jgi:hypothetical protein
MLLSNLALNFTTKQTDYCMHYRSFLALKSTGFRVGNETCFVTEMGSGYTTEME